MTHDAHLLLVRHAEPVDKDRCHGARSDPGLSEVGREQAEDLGRRVRGATAGAAPVRRLITSPATRARTTAVMLGESLGRAVQLDGRWAERDFGAWEGEPWTELWPTVPEEVTTDPEAYLAWTPPGGESAAAVLARVRMAVHDALAGPDTTVVIAHAGTIRMAVTVALDLPPTAGLKIELPYAGMVSLTGTDEGMTLTHLDE